MYPLFDSLEKGVAFDTIFLWTLFVVVYNSLFELFNKWRLNVYVPKTRLVLHEGVQGELYKKACELDQMCYDDPEFYNDFIWAIRESDSRVVQIMEDFGVLINRIISTTVVLGVLVSMDMS